LDKSLSASRSAGQKVRFGKPVPVWKGLLITALFAFCCLVFSNAANAQDKIIQKDGTEINAKVLGTDSKYVRYKRFDNPSGPDYFIYLSDVVKIEYENGKPGEKGEPLKLARKPAGDAPADLQLLEHKATQYKKRSTIYLVAGTAAIVAGAVTMIKLNSDYNTYKSEIQNTNDTYTAWYKSNYDRSPPETDLQKQKSFTAFATPGVYFGAAAIVGGIALELIGLKNVQLAKKKRAEIAQQKKELSFQPFYESKQKAAGLRVAFSF
jgi:hypothetical protein